MEKSKIVLLGYMGSGKSAVAKHIARERNLIAIDLDSYIEQKEALPIRQVFAKHGEIYFRKKEYEYLLELLGEDTYDIISLGGGTPCYAGNMDIIRNEEDVKSVYLQANIPTLTERISKNKKKRPLVASLSDEKLSEFIAKHLFERKNFYEQAHYTVSVNDKDVKTIVTEVRIVLH